MRLPASFLQFHFSTYKFHVQPPFYDKLIYDKFIYIIHSFVKKSGTCSSIHISANPLHQCIHNIILLFLSQWHPSRYAVPFLQTTPATTGAGMHPPPSKKNPASIHCGQFLLYVHHWNFALICLLQSPRFVL